MAAYPEQVTLDVGEGKENDLMDNEEDIIVVEEWDSMLIEDLAPEVQRRIKALKRNQLEIFKVEAQFYKELHELECKFFPRYKSSFEQREAIVSGKYEPTNDECSPLSPLDDLSEVNNVLDHSSEGDGEKKEKVSGIPNFWAKIFQNDETLAEMLEDHDIPIIKHLKDIEVEMIADPMGFKLHFHFSTNPYFSNTVLTKTYNLKSEVDPNDPFAFDGPEIVKCAGCTIDWTKGKNVTVKTIIKKQKHKQSGSIRTVKKTVEAASFFNFFSPPQIEADGEEKQNEETEAKLIVDYEVGQYIRERIVPRAVLYFTGEALEVDEEEEEEEEAEDEEEKTEDEEDKVKDETCKIFHNYNVTYVSFRRPNVKNLGAKCCFLQLRANLDLLQVAPKYLQSKIK